MADKKSNIINLENETDENDENESLSTFLLDVDKKLNETKKERGEVTPDYRFRKQKIKDNIKSEEKLRNKILFRNKIKNIFSLNTIENISLILDYLLNGFTVVSCCVCIYLAINYIIDGNWILSLVSIFSALVISYINQKIS